MMEERSENKDRTWALCPITGEIMVRPVKAADGCTYEWAAIQQLIDQNPQGPVISPVKQIPLENTLLTRDEILEETIQGWIKTQPEADQLKYHERAKQYELAIGAMQSMGVGDPSDFDRLPRDIRTLLIQKYFKNLGEVDKKHLAEANIRGISPFFNLAIEPAKAKVKEYFDHIITGNFKAAEAMLKKDPGLSVERMTITDLSGRVFKDITGFQYAVYARFTGIPKMIASYMRPEQAKEQFQQQMDLENENAKAHGPVCLAVDEWEEKLRVFMDRYKDMSQEEFVACFEQARKDWCEGVGGAQVKQTAKVRLFMMERAERARTEKFHSQIQMPWSREALARWSHEGLGVTKAWILGPPVVGCLIAESHPTALWVQTTMALPYDQKIVAHIKHSQDDELAELKILYGADLSQSMGQKGRRQ